MLPDLRTALVALAIGLGVGAIGSWYAHSKGKQQGKESVQAMWNAERLALATAQAEEAAKARQKEQTLQTLLAQQRKDRKSVV